MKEYNIKQLSIFLLKPFLLYAVVLLLMLVGCSRGPDEEALRKEVKEALSQKFEAGLVEITSLERRGSSPLPKSKTGASRLIVYYNATLKFLKDYNFSGWDNLSPANLAQVMGATERGLIGVKSQQKAGDFIHVYGSTTYQWIGNAWQPVYLARKGVSSVPDQANTAMPLHSIRLIDQLAKMVDIPPPGLGPQQDKIIAEELAQAMEDINRRIALEKQVVTIASGPADGEYASLADALVSPTRRQSIRIRKTDGSVQNVLLLSTGEADYAFMQNDIAAMAVSGSGPFEKVGPFPLLRAVGSLYPEVIHVVVDAKGPIRSIADLRGKRVDIGLPNSGSHYNALAVLKAHGLKVQDLAQIHEKGLEDAVKKLELGQIDAFLVTIASPSRKLEDLAIRFPIRLIPLQEAALNRLVQDNKAMLRLKIPVNTYFGQSGRIDTAAVTALLVTTAKQSDSVVGEVLHRVYDLTDYSAAGFSTGVKIARKTALKGITIPLHPEATRFFAARNEPATR